MKLKTMKNRLEPINLSKTKWAYRNKRSIEFVEEREKGAFLFRVTLRELQKIFDS